MKRPFDRDFLGVFPIAKAAAFLQVEPRTIHNWISKREFDSKHSERISQLNRLMFFPLDSEPFSKQIIGETASKAFEALQKGEPETAELITYRALHSGFDNEWSSNRPLDALSTIYCQIGSALSWVFNPDKEKQKKGHRQLVQIKREIVNLRRRIQKDKYSKLHQDALDYAYIMVAIRCLTLHSLKRLDAIRTKQRIRRKSISNVKRLQKAVKAHKQSFLQALVNWNAAQLACLDEDEATFIEALDGMKEAYGANFSILLNRLYADEDTSIMFSKDRVARCYPRVNDEAA